MLVEQGWDVLTPSHKELDLSDVHAVREKVKKITKHVTVLHAVIHIAGVWHDDQTAFSMDLEDYSTSQITDAMNVGLTGFMVCLSELLPKMPRHGVVIGVSGTFIDGASGWLPYYVSKRGLEDLLVGLAQDYPDGPLVFGVSPADTVTKAYERFFPEHIGKAQPVEVVAKTVYRLLSEAGPPSGSILEIRRSSSIAGFHK